jgi:hypothetical protein
MDSYPVAVDATANSLAVHVGGADLIAPPPSLVGISDR